MFGFRVCGLGFRNRDNLIPFLIGLGLHEISYELLTQRTGSGHHSITVKVES